MKRFFVSFLLCLFLLTGNKGAFVLAAAPSSNLSMPPAMGATAGQSSNLSTPPAIGATAGILLDLDTGAVLWEQNSDTPLPPASTTKVMTALLTVKFATPTALFTVSPQGAAVGESSAHLIAGEQLTAGDLLACALLISANDACYVLGENIAGSEPLFVAMMNLKAAALGATNSVFANTNGLPAPNHLMSVGDLARLSRLGLADPWFGRMVDTPTAYTASGTYRRYLKNTNRLVRTYPEIDGVKTGTTDAAGACLASSMTRDGRRVLAVVFHSPDRFGEALQLLEYGIDEFYNPIVCRKGDVWCETPQYQLTVAADGVVTVPKTVTEIQGNVVWNEAKSQAWLVLSHQGETLATINLNRKDLEQKQGTGHLLEKIKEIIKK